MDDVQVAEAKGLGKVFADAFSSQSGDYDPARLIGYGFVALAGLVFLGLFIFVTVVNKSFDTTAFLSGVGVITGATLGAAGGVMMKAKTENPVDYRQQLSADNLNPGSATPVDPAIPTPGNQ